MSQYNLLIKRIEVIESKINRIHSVLEATVNGATKLYEDSNWTVYRITTYDAARTYGRGADWDCLSKHAFNDIIKNHNLDGGFYFYLSKNDKREKYCVMQSKNGDVDILDVHGEKMSYINADWPIIDEVNISAPNNDDLLVRAVCNDNLSDAKNMLDNGANPNAKSLSGMPVICEAVYNLNHSMVQLLLKAGADPNAVDKTNGSTVVSTAILSLDESKARDNIIKELLKYGSKINKQAINTLCSDGNLQLIKYALDNSNDMNLDPKMLWLASDYMTNKNLELIEFLLQSGIDPNSRNAYGETLLQKASQWNQKNKLVAKYINLLKEYGAE